MVNVRQFAIKTSSQEKILSKFTSSTDFLSAWKCITWEAHSRMPSFLGMVTRSCFNLPTLYSWASSLLGDGPRALSSVASRLFCNHTIALQFEKQKSPKFTLSFLDLTIHYYLDLFSFIYVNKFHAKRTPLKTSHTSISTQQCFLSISISLL